MRKQSTCSLLRALNIQTQTLRLSSLYEHPQVAVLLYEEKLCNVNAKCEIRSTENKRPELHLTVKP